MSELIVEGKGSFGENVGFDRKHMGGGWLQDTGGRAGNEAMLS